MFRLGKPWKYLTGEEGNPARSISRWTLDIPTFEIFRSSIRDISNVGMSSVQREMHLAGYAGNIFALTSSMKPHPTKADLLEDRLINFAAKILLLAPETSRTTHARHIASQMTRSATAAAANYAEARGAESRADFVHKLRIVLKELNETTVWLELIHRTGLLPAERIAQVISENRELCRIICASVKAIRASDRQES